MRSSTRASSLEDSDAWLLLRVCSCTDYYYLGGTSLPARLGASDPLYNSDPAQECKDRCTNANSAVTAFFTYYDGRCGCSTTTSGACPQSSGAHYSTYTIV